MAEVPASIELQARALEAMAIHLRAEAKGQVHINDGTCPMCQAQIRSSALLRAEAAFGSGGDVMTRMGAGVPMLGQAVPLAETSFAEPPVVEGWLSALARGFVWGWWAMVAGAFGVIVYWLIKNKGG